MKFQFQLEHKITQKQLWFTVCALLSEADQRTNIVQSILNYATSANSHCKILLLLNNEDNWPHSDHIDVSGLVLSEYLNRLISNSHTTNK